MYKCDDCDRVFDEPRRVVDGFEGHLYTTEVCPRCGGDSYRYAELCDRCGDPELASKMQYGFCHKCATETWKTYNAFLDALPEVQKDFLKGVLQDER